MFAGKSREFLYGNGLLLRDIVAVASFLGDVEKLESLLTQGILSENNIQHAVFIAAAYNESKSLKCLLANGVSFKYLIASFGLPAYHGLLEECTKVAHDRDNTVRSVPPDENSVDLSPEEMRGFKKEFMRQDLSAAAIQRLKDIRCGNGPKSYRLMHLVSKQTRENAIRIGILKFTLERGDDINELCECCIVWYGGRPLHCLVEENSYIKPPALEVMRFLLNNGADPYAKDVKGYTPLARIEEYLEDHRQSDAPWLPVYEKFYLGAQEILTAAMEKASERAPLIDRILIRMRRYLGFSI